MNRKPRMGINPKIFKAYDIRGIYPDEVNEEVALRLGRAFVDEVGSKRVVVGYDVRLSGPALQRSLVRGITQQGAAALDIGMVSTDMFYYACGAFDAPGVMVTASHNPKEYNGFKMVKKMPDLMSGEAMRERVLGAQFSQAFAPGTIQTADVREGYRKKILSLVNAQNFPDWKIAVDPANGMGGPAFDLVYRDLPLQVTRLYFESDGNFPNHGGDPLIAENNRDLQAKVRAEKARLGFAFDTDADRCFAVDEAGEIVPADFLTALFGRYLVEKHGGGRVIYDCRSSWAVRDLVTAAGGEAVESKVGHRFIKEKMQETGALFGGEVSGHYYWQDFYQAESAVGTSLVLLEILVHYQKSLGELVAPLRAKYFGSGEINSKVPDPDAILSKIKTKYQALNRTYELDGVSVIGNGWWANVRKSNTEPLLRLKVEAFDLKTMEQKRDELLELIRGN